MKLKILIWTWILMILLIGTIEVTAITKTIEKNNIVALWEFSETIGNLTEYNGVYNITTMNGSFSYQQTDMFGGKGAIKFHDDSFAVVGEGYGNTLSSDLFKYGLNNTNYSIVIRYKRDSDPSVESGSIISMGDDAASDYLWIYEDQTTKKIHTSNLFKGHNQAEDTATNPSNMWHLLTYVQSNVVGINITLDGVEIANDTSSTIWINSSNALRFMINQYNNIGAEEAYYDEIAIINRTLTSEEISDLQLTYVRRLIPGTNVSIRKESDGSVFDYASTNETKLTVRCTSSIDTFTFNESDSVVLGDPLCGSEELIDLKVDVSYPSGDSYFRTLIPEEGQDNITFFLLDLNEDTAIQKVIELVDLTGEWQQGILRVQGGVGTAIEDIIEMHYDIAATVSLYLKQNSIYSVTLINNDGTRSRSIGNLVADTAGTVTITYPPIEYFPEVYLGEDISIDYTFNVTSGILRLQYEDTSGNTTYIRWRVYNGTNMSNTKLLQTYESTASTGATFTYSPVVANTTYYTELFAQNDLLDFNITDTRVFYDYEGAYQDVLPGFPVEDRQNFLFWGVVIFLVVWLLMFSAKHASIGVSTTAIWVGIFKGVGWFPISWVWVILIGVVAVISFIVEGMKK